MAHPRGRPGGPKKRYKWYGAHGTKVVSLDTSLVIGDRVPLVPSLGDSESQGDTTIERMILS